MVCGASLPLDRVGHPASGIAEQTFFQDQTFTMKQRHERTYRGRCRQAHQPAATLEIALPDPPTLPWRRVQKIWSK